MSYSSIYYERENNIIHLWDDNKGYIKFPYKKYAYKLNPYGKFTTLYGDKCSLITDWKYNTNLYESDISPTTRTLVDRYYETDDVSKNVKLLFLDLEVDSSNGFKKIDSRESEITAITIYDVLVKEYVTLIVDKNKQITDTKFVKVFKKERDLLQHFLNIYEEIQPNILSGWNSSEFDLPYLYERIKKRFNKTTACKLSPIGIVNYNRSGKTIEIAGVADYDYMKLYKKFSEGSRPSYALNSIANLELGHGKIEYEGTLNDLYFSDVNKFLEYNINDVKLLVELDAKLNYIEIARNICHKGHVAYDEVFMTSRYLDGATLVFAKKRGIVSPSKKSTFEIIPEYNHSPGETELTCTQNIPSYYPKSGGLKIWKSKTTSFEITYNNFIKNIFYLDEPLTDDIDIEYEIGLNLVGAYVKDPIIGRHEYTYDIDMRSEYPSNIITLNISPETKWGKVLNWNEEEYANKIDTVYKIKYVSAIDIYEVQSDKFRTYLETNKFAIASNGVFYRTDIVGIIPSILLQWFDDRDNYKSLRKQSHNEGNMMMYIMYDILQYTTKIMLNSFYGVMALDSFRYSDIDNAEAVTSSSQSLIKHSEKCANKFYNNKLKTTDVDYVLMLDTDSLFLSSIPLISKLVPNYKELTEKQIVELTLKITSAVQTHINNSFDLYAEKYHNCKKHKFYIKQEIISKSIFIIAKKRYAQLVINKEGLDIEALDVKGIETVRSDFPIIFKSFLTELLISILKFNDKNKVDEIISNFKGVLETSTIYDIMSSKSVNNVIKYDSFLRNKFGVEKGTPIHVKASLMFNDLLKYYKIDNTQPITDKEKIKWIYLKTNEFHFPVIALRGYNDPKLIVEFVKRYADYKKAFSAAFDKKLQTYYTILKWGSINENKNSKEFFEF
ncbi:MAG: hypothetical protein M0R17_09130 [Candidatus Omnitrophica bacterium]|jgi:DNA polymerase elongation subunit (family B)|nr:hypothetical protein [Candidatus Omnitrophota bacterium]